MDASKGAPRLDRSGRTSSSSSSSSTRTALGLLLRPYVRPCSLSPPARVPFTAQTRPAPVSGRGEGLADPAPSPSRLAIVVLAFPLLRRPFTPAGNHRCDFDTRRGAPASGDRPTRTGPRPGSRAWPGHGLAFGRRTGTAGRGNLLVSTPASAG
jgi:hypothetical protein